MDTAADQSEHVDLCAMGTLNFAKFAKIKLLLAHFKAYHNVNVEKDGDYAHDISESLDHAVGHVPGKMPLDAICNQAT